MQPLLELTPPFSRSYNTLYFDITLTPKGVIKNVWKGGGYETKSLPPFSLKIFPPPPKILSQCPVPVSHSHSIRAYGGGLIVSL